MTWLRDSVFCRDDVLDPGAPPEDVFDRFNQLAREAPAGSDKLIFTPWLYGEHTPVADHNLRAAFSNVSLTNDSRPHGPRGHGRRRLQHALAHGWRRVVHRPALRRDSVHRRRREVELWCQIFADVLDRPIDQVADPLSANVRGAAFVAAVGLGKLTVEDIASRVPIEKRYVPDRNNRAIYDELFKAFLEIQKNNTAMYSRLNG